MILPCSMFHVPCSMFHVPCSMFIVGNHILPRLGHEYPIMSLQSKRISPFPQFLDMNCHFKCVSTINHYIQNEETTSHLLHVNYCQRNRYLEHTTLLLPLLPTHLSLHQHGISLIRYYLNRILSIFP